MENYLRLDLKILRSKAFKDFIRSPEAPIWFYLYGYTIRGQLSSCGFGKKLYEDFYLKKKKIVARWDIKDIARNLGYKSNGHVSNLIDRLEKKWGIIKKKRMPSYGNHYLNVYEFGYLDDEGTQMLYFDTVFIKRVAEEKLERLT